MKKILAGLLSALVTTNVNAALISFEIYDSALHENRGSSSQVDEDEKRLLAQSSELFEFSLTVDNIAPFRTYHIQHEDILGKQDQVIGFSDVKAAWGSIDLFSQNHPFFSEMDVLNPKYIIEDTDATTEYQVRAAELSVVHASEEYLEEQNTDPYYSENYSDIDISLGYSSAKYWFKSENGTITGQRLMTSYSIGFEEGTELPFSSLDEEADVFIAIEQAIATSSEFKIFHHSNLVSFELTDPLGNPLCVGASYCEENEGIKILEEEDFMYLGKARATAIDYADVPEPSTNLLLAMGVMRLKRRIKA